MNAPGLDFYILQDASKKIPNAGTFKISHEDHTLGNILRMQLLKEKENYVELKIQTSDELRPLDAFKKAVEELKTTNNKLKRSFQEQMKKGACHLSWANMIAHTYGLLKCIEDPSKGFQQGNSVPYLMKYCNSYLNADDIQPALNNVKTKGIFLLKDDPYYSSTNGFTGSCTQSASSFKLKDWTKLDDLKFNSVAAILQSGKPVLATVNLYPGVYFMKSLEQKIVRFKGNPQSYGYYAIMIYGWNTNADGVVEYLYESPFGRTWRDNGASSIEVASTDILSFYDITL